MSYIVCEIFGDSLSAPHSSCIDVGEVDRLRISHGDRLKLVAKRVGNSPPPRMLRPTDRRQPAVQTRAVEVLLRWRLLPSEWPVEPRRRIVDLPACPA